MDIERYRPWVQYENGVMVALYIIYRASAHAWGYPSVLSQEFTTANYEALVLRGWAESKVERLSDIRNPLERAFMKWRVFKNQETILCYRLTAAGFAGIDGDLHQDKR